MSFQKRVEQANVLDGTVLIIAEQPSAGAYVTVAGRGDQVYILAFDVEDLATLARIHERVTSNESTTEAAVARLLAAGVIDQAAADEILATDEVQAATSRGEHTT